MVKQLALLPAIGQEVREEKYGFDSYLGEWCFFREWSCSRLKLWKSCWIALLSHCFTVNSETQSVVPFNICVTQFFFLNSRFSKVTRKKDWEISLGVPDTAFLRKCHGPSLQNSSGVLQVQGVKMCGPLKIMVQIFPVKTGNSLGYLAGESIKYFVPSSTSMECWYKIHLLNIQ